MNSDNRNERRVKGHWQLSLRFLLFLMLVLGPLFGWYGPSAVKQLRALLVSESPEIITPTVPSPFRTPQEEMKSKLVLEELERIRSISRQQETERATRVLERPSPILVNQDGTFNMRYHLPPSER
jgi:hypothetical protein